MDGCAQSISIWSAVTCSRCRAAPDPQQTLLCRSAGAPIPVEGVRIKEKDERDIAPGTLQRMRRFECYLASEGVSRNHTWRRSSMRFQQIATLRAKLFDGRMRRPIRGWNRVSPCFRKWNVNRKDRVIVIE